MTYNVFGGTLNLTQSLNQSICLRLKGNFLSIIYCHFNYYVQFCTNFDRTGLYICIHNLICGVLDHSFFQ